MEGGSTIMKINWYMISTSVLLVGIGFTIGWFLHNPKAQITTVPVYVKTETVRVEKIPGKKDTVTIVVHDTLQVVQSYKVDTTVSTKVTIQYKDADSLSITEQFPTRMRLSAEFVNGLNFYNYIEGEVYPITMPMRIKELQKNVPANTYSVWVMPMAGINDKFQAGGILGFRQFGIGAMWGSRQPTWIVGVQIRP
jgi:hypothetical protein